MAVPQATGQEPQPTTGSAWMPGTTPVPVPRRPKRPRKPKAPKPKAPTLLKDMDPAAREKRVADLVAAGKSAAVKNSAYLPEKQRKTRALNAKLNAPVIPGSTTPYREMARGRNAAVDLQFGKDAEAKRKADEDKVASYYQQYVDLVKESERGMRELAVRQQNAANSVANAAGSLPAREGALSDPQLRADFASTNTNSAARGADYLGVVGNANAALAGVRTSEVAQQLINQVTTGQKNVQTLRDQIGAYKLDYETKFKQGERSLVSAQQDRVAAALLADAKLSSAQKIQQMKESGLTDRQIAQLRSDEKIAEAKRKSDERRARIAAAGKGKGGKDGKGGATKRILPGGVPEFSPVKQRDWTKQLRSAILDGQVGKDAGATRQQLGQYLKEGASFGKNQPTLQRYEEAQAAVAADIVFFGGWITKATAARAHRAGVNLARLRKAVPEFKGVR